MGVDLVRKMNKVEVLGLTTPLLTTSSGIKMGKSISGAVWINEDSLSPYEYFQYWRNVEDADVIRFAKLYAEFSDVELAEFEKLSKENINEAKKNLAYALTKLCHGEDNAETALSTAIKVFEQGGVGGDLPTVEISLELIEKGIPCYDLFFEVGLATSRGESRRLIRGNGARVNDEQVKDENLVIDSKHVNDGIIKLSSGKKNHVLVKLV
jgi:tyrosyl-tRNA synthetase